MEAKPNIEPAAEQQPGVEPEASVEPTRQRWVDMTEDEQHQALLRAEADREARGARRRRGQSW